MRGSTCSSRCAAVAAGPNCSAHHRASVPRAQSGFPARPVFTIRAAFCQRMAVMHTECRVPCWRLRTGRCPFVWAIGVYRVQVLTVHRTARCQSTSDRGRFLQNAVVCCAGAVATADDAG